MMRAKVLSTNSRMLHVVRSLSLRESDVSDQSSRRRTGEVVNVVVFDTTVDEWPSVRGHALAHVPEQLRSEIDGALNAPLTE